MYCTSEALGNGQSALGVGPLDQGIAQSGDFIRDGVEQRRAGLRSGGTKSVKGTIRRLHRLIGLAVRGIAKRRLKLGAGGGIEGVEKMAVGSRLAARDEVMSGECHGCGSFYREMRFRPARVRGENSSGSAECMPPHSAVCGVLVSCQHPPHRG